MRLGPVHLTVTDLDRSVGFLQDAIGLQQHRRENGVAALGAGEHDIVILHEDPAALPPGRTAGLFHFALLFPSRQELARALKRLAARRVELTGASDHGVSEALYLNDPDGNGIELYVDRPREEWPEPRRAGERVGMFTLPLDVEDLLATDGDVETPRHAEPGLTLGHMHLHVGDLEAAVGFYTSELGMEEMTRYPGAAFLAWDGYHHHLGVNVWNGEGVPPQPPGSVGLRAWTAVTGGGGEERTLRDPSGNAVVTR